MSLISNALKNLFNLLGQKTPTNNGVTSSDLVPLLNSSHVPKGDVSITDLASVLGGMKQIELAPSTDMNTIFKTGLYYSTSGTIINSGVTMGMWIVLSALLPGNVYCTLQIGVDGRGKDGYPPKWRKCWDNASNGWSSWHNFPL